MTADNDTDPTPIPGGDGAGGPGEGVSPEAAREAAEAHGAAQQLTVNAQYIKDFSFEAPSTPAVFSQMQQTPPDININVNVNAGHLQDKVYEVTLDIHAECKVGETTAFICELTYAGLFTLNLPDEHIRPVLLIECPRLLFPFARYLLADVTRDGGFPPLMLGPVDFVRMYQQQLESEGTAAEAGAAPDEPSSEG